MARLFGISTEGIAARFEALSERERKLTLLLLGVFALILFGGGFYLFFSRGMEKRTQIEALERQLDEIKGLKSRFVEAKARQESEERRFRNNTVSLFSLCQGAAARFGLTIYDLNEQKAPVGGSKLLESNVSLSLKQVSIDRLTAFMEAIEDSPQGGVVKIIRLKVKTRFDAPDLLDVQMTVATWKTA